MNSTHSNAPLVHSPPRAFPLRYSRLASRSKSKRESTPLPPTLYYFATRAPRYRRRFRRGYIRLLHRARARFLPSALFLSFPPIHVISRERRSLRHEQKERITLRGNKKARGREDERRKKDRKRHARCSGNNGRSLFHITGSRLGRNRRDTLPRVHPLETNLS